MYFKREIGWSCLALIVFVACGMSTSAFSETWYVEKDGSGDFTVIQEAVEAAADGDTIMIGPGRFDDWVDVHAPAWTYPAVVWVTKDNLVFIGAGNDLTNVGPGEYYSPPEIIPKVFCCINNFRFTIRDLTVENCYDGIFAYGRLEVAGCTISNCQNGIVGFTEYGMSINRTTLGSEIYSSFGIVTYNPADNAVISNCEFVGNGKGASFTGTNGVQVQECIFSGERSAMMFYGSTGTVQNCVANQTDGTCFIARDGSDIEILDCEFNGQVKSISVNSGSVLRAENSIFRGGPQHSTIYLSAAAQVFINGCHILNGGGLSVKHEFFWAQYGAFVQDMTGNYWGTSDSDQIDAWIWDQNDDPSIFSVVNYLPISDDPVQTEETSFGSIKAMFR